MNNEYFKKVFGDWWNYIDYKELEQVIDSLNLRYKESIILPNKRSSVKRFYEYFSYFYLFYTKSIENKRPPSLKDGFIYLI